MISGRDIIIFNDDWGRFPSTLQHIARVLMKHNNRIYWVGSIGLRRPKINSSDLKRAVQKIFKVLFKSGKSITLNDVTPELIFPFIIPFHDFGIIRLLNTFLISKAVKKVLAKHKAVKPIFITSAPITDQLVGRLGEASAFYYCVDDYSSMDGAFKSIPGLEKKLVEKVDGVFAVSDFLLRTRKRSKGNTFYAPQGVETNHFKKIDQLAPQVNEMKKPVIGFFGLISEWIDLDVIYDCVVHYPDYTFVIIGKTVRDLSRFYDCKNFAYLGAVDYKELIKYASVFDVGLIPFELNDVSIAANPLKLLEYFSLGIPVVSSNLPEVCKFNDLVFVAKDKTEFVRMIRIAVEDNKEERNQLRMKKAEEFSWEAVTEKVFNTVLQIESQKTNS
ncbi:MAG: glycosyltransferase [Ignavibacteriales bacterium]|nr:glycosyltransferase [Ignavibacteriales bacterium]